MYALPYGYIQVAQSCVRYYNSYGGHRTSEPEASILISQHFDSIKAMEYLFFQEFKALRLYDKACHFVHNLLQQDGLLMAVPTHI